MSFQANWDIKGMSFQKSANAFIRSGKVAVQPQNLKKHQSKLNKQFKQHIQDNMLRSGMNDDNLQDVFSLTINENNINFVNTEPLITQRYEYGYYEDDTVKDTNHNSNDEFVDDEYIIQTSPKYFIRPSIQESLKDVGDALLNDAKKEYINHR